MAEKNKPLEDIKKLLTGEGASLNSNITLLALLEVQKSVGKTEANVTHVQDTVDAHGKKLNRIEIMLALATGGVAVLLYLINLIVKNLAAIHALLATPPS